jgi:molecular chaperone GrpE
MMTDKDQNAAPAEAADHADDEAAVDGRAEAPGTEAEVAEAAAEAPTAADVEGGGRDDRQRGEVAALKDRHLRLAAEFENYRKRVERERTESWTRAQAQLAERLLEPLDDLERIAGFDPETKEATAVFEATEMVRRKLIRSLEAAGLETIEAEARPFDPTVHEALTTVPTEDPGEDDTVAQVYQQGYRFKGVLLRPARVVVKKHGG